MADQQTRPPASASHSHTLTPHRSSSLLP
ncbi:hypothetical protein CKAH01_02457 [Colletotrichum kahawae]|uniref:Uncharacterized protein n=1 Tax=Colletotrichum kahawae TaxID=34407 RepID=A0AAD9XYL6_COLKA|nr:hypothetical protein CKAH01_02457 [Colletotrichum kahawae]